MRDDEKKNKLNLCPEFPFFGAPYPDARCINGYLFDMDKCDEVGNLYDNGEKIPCPFCNKEEFIECFGEEAYFQILLKVKPITRQGTTSTLRYSKFIHDAKNKYQ